jgi:arabinoxylan arabinofuranohydrolase
MKIQHIIPILLLAGGITVGAQPAASRVEKPLLETNSVYAGKPYGGQRHQIPGIILAKEFDVAPSGVSGITYHCTSQAGGRAFRTADDSIALVPFGKGHVTIAGLPEDPSQVYVGYIDTGEWLKYSVHVAESGVYQIGGHFAAGFTNAALSVTFSPALKTGPIHIPTTAGYQPNTEVYHVWEKLDDLAEIPLPAGDYVMTVKIEEAGGMNIDYLSFIKKP